MDLGNATSVGGFLNIDKIGKSFGGLKILTDVSFSVSKGERIGIIGPNGAGKTTLFNMIAGEFPPTNGDIYYEGENITKLPNYKRVRKGMARTFQKNNLLNDLTVLDNLLLVLQKKVGLEKVWYKPRTNKRFPGIYDEADRLLETWQLQERRDTVINRLSYGEQRQIEILLGIATEPRVLLLDEPTAGMSNAETSYILNLLNDLPKDLTLLIIEHDMDVLFSLSDRIIVLHNGVVLAEGTPDQIKNDPRVTEVYFGKEEVV
ncbi:ABC transporter ATP-binding protein [Desertibacillus haloalkaliphilus]|uniref:ABC transporter ATP-binding protein n=1 Tax=Desertibacillus haloalkaliphilus TaxID=1328930 RepID=UPI001C25D3C7|nr:ABC transporter ATP-binding protein [Desertibacillus haloalkaliphilus]MBU8908204.1 ABC transporter ATP-binding protein [Desertibacillus haloalkaliphilus]